MFEVGSCFDFSNFGLFESGENLARTCLGYDPGHLIEILLILNCVTPRNSIGVGSHECSAHRAHPILVSWILPCESGVYYFYRIWKPIIYKITITSSIQKFGD